MPFTDLIRNESTNNGENLIDTPKIGTISHNTRSENSTSNGNLKSVYNKHQTEVYRDRIYCQLTELNQTLHVKIKLQRKTISKMNHQIVQLKDELNESMKKLHQLTAHEAKILDLSNTINGLNLQIKELENSKFLIRKNLVQMNKSSAYLKQKNSSLYSEISKLTITLEAQTSINARQREEINDLKTEVSEIRSKYKEFRDTTKLVQISLSRRVRPK